MKITKFSHGLVFLMLVSNAVGCAVMPSPVGVQAIQTSVQEITATGSVITFSETLRGIQAVVSGQPNTFVVRLRDMYTLGFPHKGSWGVVTFSSSGFEATYLKEMVRASRTSPLTLTSLVKFMTDSGGKFIPHTQIPPTLIIALGDLVAWAGQAGLRLITIPILFIPIFDGGLYCPPELCLVEG